jgi:hypothetical protein
MSKDPKVTRPSRGIPPLQEMFPFESRPPTDHEVSARYVFAACALLGWSTWQLAERSGVSVRRLLMLRHGLGWPDVDQVISACFVALRSAGVVFSSDGQLELPGRPPPRSSLEPRPTIDDGHRTLWNKLEYSIYAEWEYAVLAWPGGMYPIGRHYGDCTSAIANVSRGWCVTGGAGVAVTIFEDGFPRGLGAVDPMRVLSYTVGSTGVPEGVEATAEESRDFLIGAIGSPDILWVDSVWQDRDELDSDVVWIASREGKVFRLEVRAANLYG